MTRLLLVVVAAAPAWAESDDPPAPKTRGFFALGFGGSGHLTDDSSGTQGAVLSIQIGGPIGPVQLVGQFDTMPGTISEAQPAEVDDYANLLLGVRISPFAPLRVKRTHWLQLFRYTDLAALYVQPMIGGQTRRNISYQTGERVQSRSEAFVGGIHVGYVPFQGHDYAFGFEGRLQGARYADGVEVGWGFVAVANMMW